MAGRHEHGDQHRPEQTQEQKTMTPTPTEVLLYEKIDDAYMTALDGRDHTTVSIIDLLPAIEAAVPEASHDDIEAALTWAVARQRRELDSFRRYRNAKFGNAGKVAKPGDGTLPFTPRGPNERPT
jgi:hypothetical protein